MITLVENKEPNLSKTDCIDWLGRGGLARFADYVETGRQRIGQAWFNCLGEADQNKLRGTSFDPFYKDSWADVVRALRFLLDN